MHDDAGSDVSSKTRAKCQLMKIDFTTGASDPPFRVELLAAGRIWRGELETVSASAVSDS
jgi:hypothetical protein